MFILIIFSYLIWITLRAVVWDEMYRLYADFCAICLACTSAEKQISSTMRVLVTTIVLSPLRLPSPLEVYKSPPIQIVGAASVPPLQLLHYLDTPPPTLST